MIKGGEKEAGKSEGDEGRDRRKLNATGGFLVSGYNCQLV